MKHTPGPWLIDAGMCHSGDIATIYNTTDKWVTIYAPNWAATGIDEHEQSANARLISAAPDLLSALNAMITHMGMDEDEYNKSTFDKARAAIAKATGEQNE